MSQIQNNTPLNYIQPLLVLGVAYFAGSKRFIQHFPGASQGGLALAGGVGGLLTYGSHKAINHQWPGKEESPLVSFARVSTLLACSTLGVHFIAKSLKGRVTLSLPAAVKLIEGEIALALGFATISHFQTSNPTSPSQPEKPKKPDDKKPKTSEELVQEAHQKYTQGEWDTLSPKEQSTWVKKFFDANLPLISLTSYPENAESTFDITHFEGKKLSELSKNQQAWYLEIYCFHLIPQRKAVLSLEMFHVLKNNKRCLKQLVTYFNAHPVPMLELDTKVKGNLATALKQHKLSPLTKNRDLIKNISEKQINALSPEDVQYFHTMLSNKPNSKNSLWKSISKQTKAVFNAVFQAQGLKEIR